MKFAVVAAVVAGSFGVLNAAAAHADGLPVLGGPTYDPATGTGIQSGSFPLYFRASANAGDGFGFGTGRKIVNGVSQGQGFRPFYWDSTGAIELGLLETSGTSPTSASVTAISAAGAVGSQYDGDTFDNERATLWNAAGNVTGLPYTGPIGPNYGSYASHINATGTVIGNFQLVQPNEIGAQILDARPIRWEAGTHSPTALDSLGTNADGRSIVRPVHITSDGTAFGYSQKYVDTVNRGDRAVRWDAGGTAITELGTPGVSPTGFASARLRAAADSGIAVGYGDAFTDAGQRIGNRPIRWDADGTAEALDNLGDANGNQEQAWDVNDAGTAVGQVRKAGLNSFNNFRAVRWNAGTTAVTELGVVGADTIAIISWAHEINNNGLAVGTQRIDANGVGDIAVLWGLDGVAVDLNTLIDPDAGWQLLQASSISETNWVAGVGQFDPDGTGPTAAYFRAFLIQVPEPATVGVLAVVSLGLLRRTRRECPAV